MPEQEIGVVTHYFSHLGVAAIRLTAGALAAGDTVHVKGHTSDMTFKVESLQLEHQTVPAAAAGQNIGLRTPAHAREHDKVFKVTEG
jgi:hypothetical protein